MTNVAARKQAPTVRLRRLARELRQLRAGADLSREEVSERTGINLTTLYRIEKALTRPQARTLKAMLDAYEADADQHAHLTTLSKTATTQGWLRPYHSELPEQYTAYISFEDDAKGVRNYESLFLPGLLQTEDYARAAIRGHLPNASHQDVEDRVQARTERQHVLTKDQPLNLWAIVDEAALHRLVGGKATMRAQLRHLTDVSSFSRVTVQVIPFGVGAHPGMSGSFAIMDFEDPMDSDLVYIDSMAGDLFLEADADVQRYTSMFDNLRAVALSPGDSVALVTGLARDLE